MFIHLREGGHELRRQPMARVTDSYLEERRAEILDAARRVFVRKGYDSATMQDIASEAEVAAGSIYRYFPGKADLIAAVLEDCCKDDREVFGLAGDVASPLAALMAISDRERGSIGDLEGDEHCMLRLESFLAATRDEALRAPVSQTIEDTQRDIATLLRAAQEAGELDPTVDAHDLAVMIHAFVAGVHTLRLPMGDALGAQRAWDVMVRVVSSLFLVDLAASSVGPAGSGSPASTPDQDPREVRDG
jgi:AcrR family transcriptional regulator